MIHCNKLQYIFGYVWVCIVNMAMYGLIWVEVYTLLYVSVVYFNLLYSIVLQYQYVSMLIY